jgi:hypothetical protein
MTEAEWLDCTQPEPMLELLQTFAKRRRLPRRYLRRKYRLFAVGCCRCVWDTMDPPYHDCVELAEQYVELAEQYADGKAPARKLRKEFLCCQEMATYFTETWAAAGACDGDPHHGAQESARKVAFCLAWKQSPPKLFRRDAPEFQPLLNAADARLAELLRDVIGNPFAPIEVERRWLRWNRGGVRKLAQVVYDERRFEDLPVLADALEEAGCTHADILTHCRQPGEHVRGCWVVDLLLGKS